MFFCSVAVLSDSLLARVFLKKQKMPKNPNHLIKGAPTKCGTFSPLLKIG